MTYTSTGWQVEQGVKKEKGEMNSEAYVNLTWFSSKKKKKKKNLTW